MPHLIIPFTRKAFPKRTKFFRTTEVKLTKAAQAAAELLNNITLPLVWCPSEAQKLLHAFQRCEYEILSDPDLTRFVDANLQKWQAAMYKHNQEYKNLYEVMMTLKALYKKRVARGKDHCGEYDLCCRINLGWAKLSETFDPYVVRYFNETEHGKRDKSKKGRLAELEKRIAHQENIRVEMKDSGAED
ncbi:uncharacterized protein LAJ45_01158 [Morchella importuna]|uniref:uncharacterized protein n=1 Tax=Morchella importuna TaxID=1174673 RepID=UPI001E8D40EE|nr:uncharacterized protein LAJ45_01158 [Morchella importuna]KAH8154630.1 hypothetical protein LAJ45_01158 [Morchella importuna]